ncbi:putative target of rapamycin (TOR) kinase 1 [Trypanosoma cruzi]|uniref:Putative target of rapamycin (TOR) kinase 1 n=1 Tax=Trypanosoma cruzi TaxID=5693 RepID=A0A2V2UZI7_TRYCR|nr:putative target of rapamycin (TOR) kinase 1 [Trypanosoma cruzi]PWU89520.1 putative target of rapamycin (TOR) kinase 1 [Trypanosoma cruzi]RNC39037.1 serine/threonine protein phosphatase [Trypanosoma cruzi]
MRTEARGTLGLIGLFIAILPSTMDIWVDNTSLQRAANKGSSKSHALTRELQRIYGFLDSRGIQASFVYVRSTENPADGISHGSAFTLQDLAEWVELARVSGGVLWLEEPKLCHLLSRIIYISHPNRAQHVTFVAKGLYIYILGANFEDVLEPLSFHLLLFLPSCVISIVDKLRIRLAAQVDIHILPSQRARHRVPLRAGLQ